MVKEQTLAVRKVSRKLPKALKFAIRILPLAGAAASVFFNLSRVAQELMVLIVLLWLQVYFIFELFLAGR